MKRLLAPNGKPSKLNEEQYKLVRTPAFKKFFGDWENDPENSSKVVDENGEPLICEHRTESEFYSFDKNKIGTKTDTGYFGKGFYFHPKGQGNKVYGKIIIFCFLNIKNPIKKYSYELVTKKNKINYDGIIVTRGTYDFVNNKELSINESNEIQEIMVLNPNQIKLADGSNTTFDTDNDDIRFNNGGNVLLAPNGKPSKLNEEQYKLVRTPAFKKFFGDWENDPKNASKVIDEETKEPLVLYHGSFNDFNIFDINKVGKHDLGVAGMGFYFTPNIDTAIDYSKSYKMEELSQELYDMSFSDRAKKITGYVKSFFIDMKNPKYIKYPIDIQIENYRDYKKIYSVTENLINSNYDGVIFKRGDEYGEESDFIDWEYVCFNPNQIKLADGSNTTFDENNDDIRFETGGSVNKGLFSQIWEWFGIKI